MKQGIQEFHRKHVLVPADKAANNIVVVCRLHFINTLKQELNCTKAYKETSTDEKTVDYSHSNDLPYKFAVNVKERQDKLPTMFWLPKLQKLDSLPTLTLALQQNYLNYQLLASLLSNLVSLGTMRQCMKDQGKIGFGL